ncbi:DNA internalization-related competence protein ComEC/Rec2 [Candidatus Saganbacteria bacterium]|nr:DNA internalization-related competence protein ComEC/Rec2 [Candidatus Saganbacteria bacterium]
MIPLITAYVIGIAVAYLLPVNIYFLCLLVLFIFALIAASFIKSHRGLMLLTILFLLGFINYQIRMLGPLNNDIAALPKPAFVELHGWVCEPPGIQSDRINFIVRVTAVNHQSAAGLVLINAPAEKIAYGDKVVVTGPLLDLDFLSNPGLSTFADYLKSRGISCQMRANNGAVTVVSSDGGNPLVRFSLDLIARLAAINRQTLPEYYAALSNSIVFGSQAAQLASSVKETYKQAGVAHLLVASGMQISLLSNVGMFFIKSLTLPLWPGALIISLVNIIYALMVGWGASVLRALVMSEIMLLAWLFEREGEAYVSLAISVFVLLLWQPHFLFDIGFQLTFAATWSLFYIAPAISQKINDLWPKIPHFTTTILAVALAPTLATTPITLFHFNQVSIIGSVTNLFLLPWIDLLTILGGAATLIGLIYLPLAAVLANANLILLFLADKMVITLANCPLAVIFLPTPSLPLLIGYYLALILFVAWLRNKVIIKRYSKIIMALAVVAIFVWHSAATFNARQLTITMLDVGQGDSIFVKTINGKNILIDGGGKGLGKKVVLPYLRRQGISQLDLVILTHPHDDHLSGLLELIGKIKIKAVMEPGLIYDSLAYQRFRQLIAVNQIKYYLARAGERINFDQETLGLVLAPSADNLVMGEDNVNNASIVFRLAFRRFRMLFVGDEEIEEERELLGMFGPGSLRADVLKIGHHGSATASSTDFLEAVKPKLGLISCGRHNKYHHPHKSALDRLISAGVNYLRTDQHGAITIKTNGWGFSLAAEKEE